MKFKKICMNCSNEFETEKLFDNILNCPKCLSGDIYQDKTINYEDTTIEECFIKYHNNKIANECDADKRQVIFVEE